jgi:hypothetical protein
VAVIVEAVAWSVKIKKGVRSQKSGVRMKRRWRAVPVFILTPDFWLLTTFT